MTGRALAVQAALAAAGLSVAYATWQREPERAAGDAIVVDATKSELARIHFEDENTAVDIERRGGDDGGGDGDGIWLHLLDKTPAGKPPLHGAPPAASTPSAGAPKPRPARDLRGDEPANRLFAQFAPLRSPRAFGTLDASKLKELGLDVAKRKLEVTARGQTHDFLIGSPAQGAGETYLRDTKDGRVYLMPRALLADLQGAGFRLVDRKLHAFKIPDVNRIVVTAGAKSRELVFTNRQSSTAYKLASASSPDKPDELARNWHDKIWRLYPTELMGKGEQPAGGTPKVTARIEYFDGKKPMGFVELAKLEVPAAAPSSAGAPLSESRSIPPDKPLTELYARSEHTAGWIKLSNDPSTLLDTEKVVSGS